MLLSLEGVGTVEEGKEVEGCERDSTTCNEGRGAVLCEHTGSSMADSAMVGMLILLENGRGLHAA